MTSARHLVLPVVLAFLLLPRSVAAGTPHFVGRVVVQWADGEDGPDRTMVLMEPFGFRDSAGVDWLAPAGTKIDGASIPRVFWAMAGSPFTGDYRRASVVHDYYCITKDRPWQAVHRMFYDAMVAGGVPQQQAKVYYAAVYGGGPRWTKIAGAEPGEPQFRTFSPNLTEQDLQELSKWIEAENPDLATLEAKVQSAINK